MSNAAKTNHGTPIMETTKPKLELRNVKYSAFASQETSTYRATLYVDGAPFCEVTNDGCGGPDNHYPLPGYKGDFYSDFRALDERVKATYPKRTIGTTALDEDVELLCGSLLTAWIICRDVKAYDREHGVKKLVGVMDGRLMIWKPGRGFKGDLRTWCCHAKADIARQRPEVVFWDAMDGRQRLDALVATDDAYVAQFVREAFNG